MIFILYSVDMVNNITQLCMILCVCVCVCVLSHVQLFANSCTAACQTPLSMEFSRQENWSGLPFLTPGDLPNPGIKLTSLASPAMAGDVLYH